MCSDAQRSAEIYLDNNATTRPLPEVRDAMLDVLGDGFGNPSSAHATGDRARQQLCRARDAIASLVGGDPSLLLFTSSGTESNNMVLRSATEGRPDRPRIVTTQVEHSSILKTCEYLEGCDVEIAFLAIDHVGHIDLEELRGALTSGTVLVSVQWVNNETGVIQPVQDIGGICQSAGVLFHTDAAQAVGKLEINMSRMPIDFLSLTGHKFHAPPGVGAVLARDIRTLRPLLHGGPQERELRAGTENLPGIVGIGRAAQLRRDRLQDVRGKLQDLRDRFEGLVLDLVPGAQVNGDRECRVCNTTNLRFEEVDGQALVAQLDGGGIRCSQSSACTSQRPEPSYVLRAMGLSEDEAYSSVRFSFSEENTLEEVQLAADEVARICRKLRRFSSGQGRAKTYAAEAG